MEELTPPFAAAPRTDNGGWANRPMAHESYQLCGLGWFYTALCASVGPFSRSDPRTKYGKPGSLTSLRQGSLNLLRGVVGRFLMGKQMASHVFRADLRTREAAFRVAAAPCLFAAGDGQGGGNRVPKAQYP